MTLAKDQLKEAGILRVACIITAILDLIAGVWFFNRNEFDNILFAFAGVVIAAVSFLALEHAMKMLRQVAQIREQAKSATNHSPQT